MKSRAVTLGIKSCLRIECTFWLGDDGWNGSSEHPPIAVQAGTFEQAKSEMEIALGKHVETLLHQSRSGRNGQAA
jgi:predicted RNase H-like HicB family nuclease